MTRVDIPLVAVLRRGVLATWAGRWATCLVALLAVLCTFTAPASAQSVTITANPTSFTAAGQTINFTYTLNSGSVDITSINPPTTLIKNIAVSCPAPTRGTNAVTICSGTYSVSALDDMAGSFADFVRFTGSRVGGSYNITSNTITVTKSGGGPVALSVASTPNPSQPGQNFTVTATVGSLGCNAGDAPPGTVTITVGSQSSGPLTLVRTAPISGASSASFQTSRSAGTYAVSASYSGGGGCAPSTAAGANQVVDTPPTVTINQAGAQQDPTATSPIQFSVVFDKPVTGFTGADVTLTGTAGATTAAVSGSGAAYTVSVSGMAQSGTVIASIAAGRATSAAGFGNLASTSTDNTVNFALIVISPATLPGATFGQAYSQPITASGGTSPYTFAVISGATPGGLTLAPDGLLSGTPTAAGVFSFTVAANDGAGLTQTRSYSITVPAPTIAVTPASLPAAAAGSAYSQTIVASGGTAPYTFAVTAGALPAGLTLASGGALSGTPTATGTFNFTVTATDATPAGSGGPFSGNRAYSLVVAAPTISVAPATLPSAIAGTGYSQAITASGGTAPYTFALTAGALPAGITLVSNGTLSGTPTATGSFNFTVTSTDSTTGGTYSGSRSYSLNVGSPNFTLSPPSFAGLQVGTSYTGAFSAGGGTAPYTYSILGGSLPAGLTLSSSGTLSGTPTEGGSFNFTVVARDSTTGPGAPYGVAGNYTVSVASAQITLAPASLPDAVAAQNYSQSLTASGGTAPYSFAVTAGLLPAGLTLASNGTLSGTPTATGTFSFTVEATDSSTGTGPFTGAQAYTVTVTAPTLTLAPANLVDATVGSAYSASFTAAGGTSPYSFAVTAGTLPAGLSVDSNGVLSGTPTEGGSFSFTITATDSSGGGGPYSGTRTYTLAVNPPTIAITPAAVAGGTVGTAYSQPLTASGGSGPYSFAVSAGALPDGLSLTSNGTLSGTPTAGGTFNFTVSATDSSTGSGPFVGSRAYSLTVAPATITLAPSVLGNGVVGTAYSATISASGGTGPYSFSHTAGTLPPGVSLSSGGALTGTPSAGGTFNFTVTATDSSTGTGPFSGSRSYSVTIAAPTIAITPAALPDAVATQSYSQALSASGGTAPHSFAVTAGALPPGLSLAPDGTLSGTPTATGTFNFTATATDSSGGSGPYSASRSFALTVTAPFITLAPASLPNGVTSQGYSQSLSASGGIAPYTFTITGGALPAGISLASDGTLAGTPTAGGTFNFTVTATDSSSGSGPYSASRAYALTVGAPTITLAPASLPGAVATQSYSQVLSATGGTGPYSYAITAGALPSGLSLAPGGTLAGTPTATGTSSFTVTATDSSGGSGPYSGSQSYALIVSAPTVALSPSGLTGGTVGAAYAATLSATGGTAPYSFAVSAGALPAGLTLAANGTLAGTPAAGGSFSFTVTATDSSGGSGPYSGSQAYTLTIVAPTLTLTPTTLPDATGGVAYSQTISASGGTGPYGFAITSGALPAGLTLAANGTLAGTPAAGGSFSFTVTATDSSGGSGPYSGSQAYTLTIVAPTLTLTPTTLPDATGGVAYSQTVSASGGTGPYGFAITAGALPAGLTLAANGTISGTPTTAGSFNFTVTATDSSTGTGPYSASRAYVLTVAAPAISFVDTVLDPATVAVAYSETIAAQGGTAPYSYAVTGGSLPSGTSLSPAGTLTGTPTAGGVFSFTVTATDAMGFTGAFAFSLSVASPVVDVTPASLPGGNAGQPYSETVAASGGVAPYSFAVSSGALPAGLQLAANGVISGTPTTPGSYNFTISATDSSSGTGPYSGSRAYVLTIVAPTITLVPGALPDATGSRSYSQTLSATGGTAPYIFTVSAGALPPGLGLSPSGMISGTPTALGAFTFTVQAVDAAGFKGTGNYSLAVVAPTLAITPAALPDGGVGEAYSQALSASGGTAPYAFAVTAGSLPPGLLLSTAGSLSGTPTQRGSFSFTIGATDANGFAAAADYTLIIEGEVPTVVSKTVDVGAGQTSSVSLTDGATGGPFTAAAISSMPDPALGTATIERDGADYKMVFVAATNAAGKAMVSYTLSNAAGTSAPGTITFNILDRPDPSQDAEVVGMIEAQAGSARRAADAQIRNFRDRLEQTHDEETRQQSAVNVSLGAQAGVDEFAYANDSNALDDPAALAALGYATGNTQAAAQPETRRQRVGNAAFWAGGFVNFGSREGNGIDLDQTMIGLSAGVDYRFSPQFVGGVGFGYGRDRSDVGNQGTETTAQAFSGVVYGSYSPTANFFLDGLLGYGHLDFDGRRHVTGEDEFASSERSGDQVFGSLTATYEYRSNGLLLAPYLGLEGSRSTLDAFTESGAGASDLSFGEQDVTAFSGLVGLRVEKVIELEWGVLTPRGRVGYSRGFEGSDKVELGYADQDGLPYSFDIDAFSRDRLTLGLGLDAQFDNGWSLGVDYDAEIGLDGDAQDHSLAARVSKHF